MSFKDRFQFIGISFMHDTIYGLFMNAEDLLLPAGLKERQNVLEVGCGPGFFTIPAAKIVGENGHVFANDINPFAIRRVEKKLSKTDVKNITVMQEDVTKTSGNLIQPLCKSSLFLKPFSHARSNPIIAFCKATGKSFSQ